MGAKERREREKQKRRKQILEAARQVLFEEGMTAVSMNKIATEAELSVGTLYLYFESKEELFAGLQEEGLDLLHEMISKAEAEGDSPREKLHRMALAYYEFSEKHRTYFDIVNYFLSSSEVMFPPHLKERIDQFGDRILGVLEKALVNGERNKKQVRHESLVVWSTLHGLLQIRKLEGTIFEKGIHRQLYMNGLDCLIDGLFSDD